MSMHPYTSLFDAIGFYVERAGGADVLVNEIEGGFLVAFVTEAGQQVATFDDVDLAQLRAEIAALEAPDLHLPEKSHLGARLRGVLGRTHSGSSAPALADLTAAADQPGLRACLRAVGRYLERRAAMAIVVQEQADGYLVAFTGQPPDDNLAPLTRHDERLDGHQLQAWLTAG